MSFFASLMANENFLTRSVGFGPDFALPYYVLLIALVVILALVVVLIIAATKAKAKGKRSKAPSNEFVDVRSSGSDSDEEEVIRNNSNLRSDYILVSGYVDEEQAFPKEEPVGKKTAPEEENTETEEKEDAKDEGVMEEESIEENEEEDVVEEEPIEEEPTDEKEKEETTKDEVAAEQTEEEPATEPIENREEDAPVKKEEKKTEKPVAKTETAKKESAKKEPAKKEPVKKEAAKKEPVKATENKITGKIEICNSDLGGYNYLLRANNGQLLYESKAYKSVDSTKEAIDNFIEAVKVGMFSIRKDKFNNYKFILKSPTSNNLLYIGESFSTETSCKNNVESVKRFAVASNVVDITEKDFVAKFVRYDIPEKLIKDVENRALSTGKWSIEKTDESAKNSPYEFLLYANNGQLLYESRDYKTRATCLAGLKTFVSTVKTGYFVIDPDKSGRFKFVLRNNAVNSVTEYYGENYDTKKACANNIESVYHFALLSVVPEN